MADKKKNTHPYADKDRHLVKELEKATLALIEFRWKWTQDEENDKRVSVEDYALETGVTREMVHRYAAARDRYVVGVEAYGEDYTAVEALDTTSVGAATMR